MDYEFINSSIDKDNIILPNSDKIDPFLLRNNYADIIKAVDFIGTNEKLLYIHGFMGTGKRQFINYICEFLHNDVIKLEYYCKEATVCDDILLAFSEIIDNLSISKAINLNTKITTLNVKLQQQISSIKKPFLLVLHSFDDIQDSNIDLVKEVISTIAAENNIKIIISTRAMLPSVLKEIDVDKKIFLKAFSKELFKEYIFTSNIKTTDTVLEDFYKYTRGYYYYVALSIKIIQAMKIDLNEFLLKFNQSEMSFDSYLSITYINLIPTTIRNFFWFLRTVRHGLSINALAELELYDEFSIEYLKTNLMIFQQDETLFVQDYFLQKIDISIPKKTQIKLHKYIIGIYEKQLKEQVKNRVICISRQALRAEIEFHNHRILELENIEPEKVDKPVEEANTQIAPEPQIEQHVSDKIETALKLMNEKKYTESIEAFTQILDSENIDLTTLVEIRLNLARLYKSINNNSLSVHYYELVKTYYEQHKEYINLNYLRYEITDLYFKMYKHERAIETIKEVIYSVDTPQSLLVSSCTILGNIYSDLNNSKDAFTYYQKALESLDENIDPEVLANLYFKFALTNDDKGETELAFEYYNKCIAISANNPYKALAYSNLASCYYDNSNYEDALACFNKAYEIEKNNNNYDGIYYNALHIAKIYNNKNSNKALKYILEAKSSAEFINEDFYVLESTIALGDYYYNNSATYKDALKEYFNALTVAEKLLREIDVTKITKRIEDMKLRMSPKDFSEIENKYAKYSH